MKQEDVAIKLGLRSTDRISRWERGSTFPHVINLFKLSLLYKVFPHELYGELIENIRVERGNNYDESFSSNSSNPEL